jgi:hypothetical protein
MIAGLTFDSASLFAQGASLIAPPARRPDDCARMGPVDRGELEKIVLTHPVHGGCGAPNLPTLHAEPRLGGCALARRKLDSLGTGRPYGSRCRPNVARYVGSFELGASCGEERVESSAARSTCGVRTSSADPTLNGAASTWISSPRTPP